MPEEINLTIGIPEVVKTEIKHGGVLTRAYEVIPGANRPIAEMDALSIHYHVESAQEAPHIGENLLVAVLSGIHNEWLPSLDVPTPEPVAVISELVSAETSKVRKNEDTNLFDMLHMKQVERGRCTRLHVAMSDESKTRLYGAVVLNKWQVTQMIAALLAIYPRLHED